MRIAKNFNYDIIQMFNVDVLAEKNPISIVHSAEKTEKFRS